MMDDFHDLTVLTSAQAQLAIVKFWHAAAGLYFWEFFTTLDYEWRVIRGDLPYQWTIWIYSSARVGALVGLILCLSGMDVTTQINCQLVLFASIFLCLSATAAALLIVLRTIAIWNRNRVVGALAITIWLASVAFHLQNISRLRYAWNSTQLACEPVKTDNSDLGFLSIVLSDIAVSLITLAGLFSLRRRHRGGTLAHLLWKQGVIWLALGFVAEVPPLVFTFLHLNDQLHNMFEIPGVIILIIASTRMHRSLVDFASGSSDVYETNENPQLTSLVLSKAKRTDTALTALDRVEVSTHIAPEQHPTGTVMSGAGTSTTISTTFTCPLPSVSPSPISGTQNV